MSMALNGISTLASKELRQKAKLNLAKTKRQAGGDNSKPYYRANNDYDLTRLPTQYSGNNIVDNPNPGGLLPSRPWKPGV